MRSEFEKLSQIESHLHNVVFDEGSNKYLTKKMGYLPFEFSEWFLNGSWLIYRHQQSKIDALTLQVAEMNSRLNDAYTDGQSAMYTTRQSKIDELQKRVDALTLALDQIAYPIPHMQKEAELNGCELNGYWAVKMSEDHTYSKDIARRALEKEQALKGD